MWWPKAPSAARELSLGILNTRERRAEAPRIRHFERAVSGGYPEHMTHGRPFDEDNRADHDDNRDDCREADSPLLRDWARIFSARRSAAPSESNSFWFSGRTIAPRTVAFFAFALNVRGNDHRNPADEREARTHDEEWEHFAYLNARPTISRYL
jgi:hypothetical protein